MMLRKWEDLPQEMRTEEVRPYYDLLRKKQGSLLCKRLFDILASLVLLVLLSPVFLVLALPSSWTPAARCFTGRCG